MSWLIVNWQDWVNAGFELFGSIGVWFHIWALYKNKKATGVEPLTFVLFSLWGYWNLYYYAHLGQTASVVAGISIAVANTVWVIMYYYYKRKEVWSSP